MKKILLIAFVALTFVGLSQKVNKKFVDGIIYFQLKSSANIIIKSDSKGRTDLKVFSFFGNITSKYGVTRIDKSFYMAKDEKLLRTFKVYFNKINDADKLVADLKKLGVVEYAEKLPVYKLSYVPNDPIYSQTTGSGTATMHFNWPLTRINAASAWNITKGSAAIKVAIVDNAIYTAHPDLTNKIVAQYDAADLDNIASPPGTGASDNANYEWSHGTHVAGLVGAQSDNGIGTASIGFSVSLVAVKIAQDATGNLTAGYEGITWASTTGGAKVINMSWGGYGSSTTAQNVVTAAYNQGCVLVAAAGNNGDGGEDMANINGTLYPAAYTECIAVAATNSDDTKASFSEYGSWVDVCAPGGNEKITGWSSPYVTPLISTTWCNTYGINAYYGLSNSLFGTNAKYDGMQGTSMASPLVAGLAGLIWSVNPSMTKVQVRNCIISTATNISSINSATPALSGNLGSGRIDAYAAVQCAQATASVAPTASFTGTPLNICPGSTVTFTNLTTSSATVSYAWNFQGGTPATSTQTNVTVTYNTPGIYSVTLTATNVYGTNSSVQTGYVNVIAGAAIPLIEGFQASTFAPTNWYLVDAGNDGVKWALKTTAGQASTQSAYFDNFDDAANAGYRDELKTFVNLSGYSSAKMTFYRAYAATFSTPNLDSLQIGISTNCGASVTSAYLKGGPTFSTAVTSNTAVGFVPTSTQWKKDSIDLTPYVGQASVMVSFINRGHYGDNLYLDNINITGVTAASPTAAISSASTGCTGSSITLTDASTGGASSWTWTMPGGTPASATTQNTSVTYATAGVKTISLTVANASGTTTATKTITITATPTVAASITNTTICSGNSIIETLTGAAAYSWLPSGSGATSTLTPASTTVYSITGTTGGCASAVKMVTVTVTNSPTVGVTASSASICAGQSTTLTASGAASYMWMPGSLTTTVITVNPTSTTVYTVTGSNGSCSSTKTISINVSTTPTITVSLTNTTVCSGTPVTVNVSGATNYSWLPSGSGSSSVLTPAATTVYSVTGDNGGCSSTVKTFTINVNTTPTVGVTASSNTICAGQSTTLTATGAATYMWMPGSLTTTAITVNPTGTTVYTVTGSNGSCSSTKTIAVNVTAPPTITVSLTNTTVCSGTPVTVNLSGATSYNWLPTGSGSSSVLTPAANTIYTVTGSIGSCNSAAKTFTINVNATPTVVVSASSNTICAGQSTTLTASGAATYMWMPGSLTTAAITVNPAGTTVYTVTGSNSSCSSAKTITVNVITTPTISASVTNTTVCSGSPVVVNMTGAATYNWLPAGSGSSSTLTPAANTTYTVTGSTGSCNGNSIMFTVNVTASPVITASASPTLICTGKSAVLTAAGAANYSWSPSASLSSATGSTVSANPNTSTLYTVTGSNGTCTGTQTVNLTVSTCTGIESFGSSNDISLYPNPSAGVFIISSTSNNGKLDVSVINTLGQTVMMESSKDPKSLMLDMSSFSKGVYYVKIQMNDGAKLIKVILD